MIWNAFKHRVETLRTSHKTRDEIDEQEIRLEPVNDAVDRESFVRRIKAVLAA